MIAFFKLDGGAPAPANLRRLSTRILHPPSRIDTPVVDEVKGLDRIVYGLTLTLSGMRVGVSAR